MNKPIKNNRTCDSCTECCKGWLYGEAHGKPFYSGRPCHFVGEKGCTIYKDRPHDPCVTFKCGWLENQDMFPAWLKPNVSKILAKKEKTKQSGIDYYKIHECGQKIDSTVLNYLIIYALTNGVNINVQVDGGWNNFGSDQFLKEISKL